MNDLINSDIKFCIVLATQRSGSTMIIEDMRNTKAMGVPEEYFIPWNASKDIDWAKSLKLIIKKASTPNGICAIKIMSNQIPHIDQCLEVAFKNIIEVDSSKLFPYFTAVFANSKPIVLRRRNYLRQAISRKISRDTGINHATQDKDDEHFAGNLMKGYNPDYNSEVKYSYVKLQEEIISIANENILLDKVVEDLGFSRPLELYYESIVLNGMLYIDRIAKYIGVEEYDNLTKRNMVKLSNEKNEDLFNKYINDYLSSL